jgi:hypothetical protein
MIDRMLHASHCRSDEKTGCSSLNVDDTIVKVKTND